MIVSFIYSNFKKLWKIINKFSYELVYEDYIFTDVCQRYDLAFTWLFQEYVNANGYVKIIEPNQKKDFTKYDNILYRLLKYLKEKDYE